MTTTTDPLNALLAIRDGDLTARWNYDDAAGTPIASPGGVGNAVSLTYSFPLSMPWYFSGTGFAAFEDFQQIAAREALAAVSSVARVSFTEVSGIGDITFAMNAQDSPAYAFYPSFQYYSDGVNITSATPTNYSGDVWFNSGEGWTAQDFEHGEFGFETLLHELGHALGLKHPFQSGAGGYTLEASLDNRAYTVMSYSPHPHGLFRSVTDLGGGGYSWAYHYIEPETMMPFDIAALQYLYGANRSYHSGNDTYSFQTDRPFIKTIWDAGGIDTISVSNFSLGCAIDLRAGFFSSISIPSDPLPAGYFDTNTGLYDGTDNLAIAYGVVIENARGGAGKDQLIGNSASNQLDGRAGADTMTGGNGSDTYLVENDGDVVVETNSTLGSGGSDTVWSYLSNYQLGNHIENGRIMSAGSASLSGNASNNLLYAGKGGNTLTGGSGVDTVSYAFGVNGVTGVGVSLALGTAQATVGSGWDTLSGIENLVGSAYADTLTGSSGSNAITGGGGNDSINGGAGADTLVGGAGKDNLAGGAGIDTFDFNALGEMGITSTSWDVISDFVRGEDRIDLSTLDANAVTPGNSAFVIVASTEFTSAGQLRFASGVLYGNTDSDSTPEFAIKLVGLTGLDASNLIL